ncbi:MAG: hypothetical protein RTV41_13170 [Candidatus Thorarchaeota archaeon]
MTPMRSDGVVLGTLLQAIRGILLFVFNWTLFIRFGQTYYIPGGVDIMAALPPTIYFLIGFMDILTVRRVWRGDHNGWRYGIAMSILILWLIPATPIFYLPLHILFLQVVIDLLAVAQIIVLVIPNTRRFYQP